MHIYYDNTYVWYTDRETGTNILTIKSISESSRCLVQGELSLL